MEKTLISASILSANPLFLSKEIESIENSGTDWHHVDVMDGHFVPNLTFGPPLIKSLKTSTKIPLDVHLMITNPDDVIEQYIQAGSDYITFHLEASKNPKTLIKIIKENGVKAGISIKPKTKVSDLKPYLADLDLILLMSVEPGFSGQTFIKNTFSKLEELSNLVKKKNLTKNPIISVDGGVNNTNANNLIKAGATCLVTGSFLYKSDNKKETLRSLKNNH